METITISTDSRLTTVDVTDRVAGVIHDGVPGTCTVFVAHTTASVVMQENESGLRQDIETILENFTRNDGWVHDRIDDNADTHLRATLLGPSVTVPVREVAWQWAPAGPSCWWSIRPSIPIHLDRREQSGSRVTRSQGRIYASGVLGVTHVSVV